MKKKERQLAKLAAKRRYTVYTLMVFAMWIARMRGYKTHLHYSGVFIRGPQKGHYPIPHGVEIERIFPGWVFHTAFVIKQCLRRNVWKITPEWRRQQIRQRNRRNEQLLIHGGRIS